MIRENYGREIINGACLPAARWGDDNTPEPSRAAG